MIVDDGYKPDTSSVQHDVEEAVKIKMLNYHSERLAIAFGLIFVPSGLPIRVGKNLRVCVDCHTAMKHIFSVTGSLFAALSSNWVNWSRYYNKEHPYNSITTLKKMGNMDSKSCLDYRFSAVIIGAASVHASNTKGPVLKWRMTLDGLGN
ncbi:hypothetical protein Bca4012_049739 [Brassica carinata]|uniref:DYW domain-containing protein n=1 Tax=Brassica oleracea var. oleracea TaxID=109376 RepID=A0A0D3AP49_BRAOL